MYFKFDVRKLKNTAGTGKNENQAFIWFLKAAEQGLALGQYNLGLCYLNGWGTEKDRTEAKRWFKKAAEQGNEGAKKILKDEFGED